VNGDHRGDAEQLGDPDDQRRRVRLNQKEDDRGERQSANGVPERRPPGLMKTIE
jgi:hypothetical protein